MPADTNIQEQIVCGLWIIWKETLGYEAPLHLDMNFAEEFKAGGMLEDYDFADVIYRIQRDFGFKCARKEWNDYLGLHIQDLDEWNRDVSPRLTFRTLADFIRERLQPISFKPLTLLGKPCLTAGIFRALERLAGQIHPAVKQFGPSTPIRARLRGSRLQRFWDRLRWITRDQIPLSRRITLGCGGFYFKIGIGLLIALWNRDLASLGLSLIVTALLFFATAFVVEFINSQIDPLPKEIKTFGDLARYLTVITVDQQTEDVSCLTP